MEEISSNITTNNPSSFNEFEDDFFKELYSESTLKHFTIAIFFFGSIFGLFLEFGLIWYEKYGNNRYRTVINQLFSFVSWLVVAYIVFVYIPEGIRYLIGPLSETFCDVHNLLKNVLSICLVLTLDLIIIHRYISIFKSLPRVSPQIALVESAKSGSNNMQLKAIAEAPKFFASPNSSFYMNEKWARKCKVMT